MGCTKPSTRGKVRPGYGGMPTALKVYDFRH